MNRDELLSHVAMHAGLPDSEAAERTVRVVLGVLGEQLSGAAARELEEELPPGLGAALREVQHDQHFGLEELEVRVAQREGVRLSFAVEHVGVVVQALARALLPAALYRLREALPDSVAALLTPPEEADSAAPVHLHPEHHTLAEGRPGSRHPLSETRPERAPSQSVLRADNPHGDTKLSSALGLTQEREEETLATGRPGRRHGD